MRLYIPECKQNYKVHSWSQPYIYCDINIGLLTTPMVGWHKKAWIDYIYIEFKKSSRSNRQNTIQYNTTAAYFLMYLSFHISLLTDPFEIKTFAVQASSYQIRSLYQKTNVFLFKLYLCEDTRSSAFIHTSLCVQ